MIIIQHLLKKVNTKRFYLSTKENFVVFDDDFTFFLRFLSLFTTAISVFNRFIGQKSIFARKTELFFSPQRRSWSSAKKTETIITKNALNLLQYLSCCDILLIYAYKRSIYESLLLIFGYAEAFATQGLG